uniref:Putative acetylcholinesterase/butyrylcholinesterase n=1 Tax=Ixodes ricinus TaxID=34613 RepID=A0A0K8R3L2_IXORI
MQAQEQVGPNTNANMAQNVYRFIGCGLVAMLITIIILILSNVTVAILFHKHSSQDCFQVSLVTGKVMGLPVNFQHAGHTYHTTAFLGIPFAENTGGTRRFKKPIIYHGWEGVFNATYRRKPCCQRIMQGKRKICFRSGQQYRGLPSLKHLGSDRLHGENPEISSHVLGIWRWLSIWRK